MDELKRIAVFQYQRLCTLTIMESNWLFIWNRGFQEILMTITSNYDHLCIRHDVGCVLFLVLVCCDSLFAMCFVNCLIIVHMCFWLVTPPCLAFLPVYLCICSSIVVCRSLLPVVEFYIVINDFSLHKCLFIK